MTKLRAWAKFRMRCAVRHLAAAMPAGDDEVVCLCQHYFWPLLHSASCCIVLVATLIGCRLLCCI